VCVCVCVCVGAVLAQSHLLTVLLEDIILTVL